ncbi:MAG TPA: S53 family peptidase [Solirubrobacterales bacterium]|nr:S53 family peptidase [Solirubrobacterales bacterium]
MARTLSLAPAAFVVLAVLAGAAEGRGTGDRASASANESGVRAPKGDRVTFQFGLRRPEGRARAAFYAVSQPGSPAYRRFASLGRAATVYGASARTKKAFRRAVRRRGLVARIHRSGVFARVRGRVGRIERAFRVRIRKLHSSSPPKVDIYWVAGHRGLRLGSRLRALTREVVTTYWRSPGARSKRATARAATGDRYRLDSHGPVNEGTWEDGCDDAKDTGGYSYAQVRGAYEVDAVGAGDGGSVAIVNVAEGVTPRDIADAAACFGLPELATRTLLADGQARPFGHLPPFSAEPQLDLALVRGMAPELARATFAQAWYPPELWFVAAAKVLALPTAPDALSISYGECERGVRGRRGSRATRSGARLLDSVLVRLGIRGVATFASAGDFGSTCNGKPFAGVTWPASSPFATAVGGTRLVLDAANARVDEVVWNDLEWLGATSGGGAGGGGFSAVSARPPYQRSLAIGGERRVVPDVSAHASLFPGWPVVIAGNWLAEAGTSASAPLLAGAFATLSASERAAGRPPVGPVNGLLYELGKDAPATLFDVVSGANGYDPKVPARSAGPGYDLASGWGVPRFDAVAAALPPPAPDGGLRATADRSG